MAKAIKNPTFLLAALIFKQPTTYYYIIRNDDLTIVFLIGRYQFETECKPQSKKLPFI